MDLRVQSSALLLIVNLQAVGRNLLGLANLDQKAASDEVRSSGRKSCEEDICRHRIFALVQNTYEECAGNTVVAIVQSNRHFIKNACSYEQCSHF